MIPDALHPLGRRSWRTTPPAPPLPYDSEVDYLESTGTQYIDTGIMPSADLEIAIRFVALTPWQSYMAIIGSYAAGGNASNAIAIRTRNTSVDGFNVVYNVSTPIGNDGDTTIVMRRGSFSANGVDYAQTPSGSTYGNMAISIFTSALGSTPTIGVTQQPMRLYYLRITQSGVLVRDFIPVRIGTTGALYDKLGTGGMNPDGSARNDGMYFNRGTGAFLYGSDKTTS